MRCGLLIYRPLHPTTPAARAPRSPGLRGQLPSSTVAVPTATGSTVCGPARPELKGSALCAGSRLTWLLRRPVPARAAHDPGRAGTLTRRELLRPGRRARNVPVTAAWRGAAPSCPAHLGPRPSWTSSDLRGVVRDGANLCLAPKLVPKLRLGLDPPVSAAPGPLVQSARSNMLPVLSFALHQSGTHQAPWFSVQSQHSRQT